MGTPFFKGLEEEKLLGKGEGSIQKGSQDNVQ